MRKGDATKLGKMSVEEYFAFEETADIRHEYYEGNLIPMPGTTNYHNFICLNIAMALRILLKGTPCKVCMENVKVKVTHEKDYTYPDIVVTCDERDFEKTYLLEHPSVIFEVSSPSTKVYDKTDKFIRFRKISSLRHYIVINSEKVDIEIFSKENGEWVSEHYSGMESKMKLSALDIELPVADIYLEVLK